MSFQVDNVFWLGCDSGIIAVVMNEDHEALGTEMINADNSPMNNLIIFYFYLTFSFNLSPLIQPLFKQPDI